MKKYGYAEVVIPAKKKLKEILDRHGIELSINACGCCMGPSVRVRYRGEWITPDGDHLNEFNFSNIDGGEHTE